jgi:hypothetical protein
MAKTIMEKINTIIIDGSLDSDIWFRFNEDGTVFDAIYYKKNGEAELIDSDIVECIGEAFLEYTEYMEKKDKDKSNGKDI